ncbi:MAG: hypothetical protein H7321_02665, partial [Bacteroidia bacterium]|nr:hypothetical protein [Bacteroidia bacterium]
MKKIFFIAIIAGSINTLNAQVDYSEYVTSGEYTSYTKTAVRQRPVVSHPYLREADVKFSRRVWRVIDTRQKMNKVLVWPKNPLTQILYNKIVNNEFVAYNNDSLTSFTTSEDMKKKGSTEVVVAIPIDPTDPYVTKDSIYYIDYKWQDMQKIMLVEDWIFDYKHSVFKPRIVAIVPLYRPVVAGIAQPEQDWTWMKYDDIRPVL